MIFRCPVSNRYSRTYRRRAPPSQRRQKRTEPQPYVTRNIVVKFEEINLSSKKFNKVPDKLKFVKVRKSSRCKFDHNYYRMTLSCMGLDLCNLKKTTEIRILHVVAETKADDIQIRCIIQCYVRNYLHF